MKKVIVVGGGPAGCASGITIKKLMPELEVELFEQRPKVSKVECGEAISRKAVEENSDIVGKFINKCIRRNVNEFHVIISENTEKIVKSPGYMIDRNIFNKSLLKEAEKVGCRVKMGYKAKPISRIDERWKVRVEDNYAHKVYFENCDMIILAGGASCREVKDIGVISENDYENWKKQHVFGYQYKISSPFQEERLLVDFRPNPTPDIVYRYIFYHHDDISNFGLLYKGRFVSKSFYDTFLKEYLKKMKIKKFKIIERPTGNYIPSGGPIPKTYGNGVLVVGDAAGFANPIFFGGIHTALASGKIAGEIAVEAFKNNNLGESFLKDYEVRWRKMPWGNPILMEGKRIHEKVRKGQSVSLEELEIYSKSLDITKDYGW